ncbi:MAG: YggS family pyridoxal phosphate-dependent enzyme [Xanthomonadales bacterium]
MFPFLDSHAPPLTINQCIVSRKMKDLKAKLHNVRARIESACKKAGRRPSEITVLAVSKRHPAGRIRQLHELGLNAFGENYMQEAVEKQAHLADLELVWHFIGPVQSNKTRELARHFSWVQSAGREKILRRLSAQRPEALPKLNICIQVNIDREEQKSGVLPENLEKMAHFALGLPNLRLRGLMSIPRLGSADHDPTDSYRRMKDLFLLLIDAGIPMDTLSMGMSADLENAIMQGSTMLRIGTDLFGARP